MQSSKLKRKMEKFLPVIGLEVHVELATKSKMFCGCPGEHFGKKPNTQTCPVCLGLPGALPVPNKKAVEWTIVLGLALGCKINSESKFDRKHYFYPDLPKGYQISQYDQPLCYNGKFEIRSTKFEIGIRRVHLEEDTGKLVHSVIGGKRVSLVDFNRSGVPLVEVVTEPDFSQVGEVMEFLRGLQHLVRWVGISEADMEKGSMRLEANVSLRRLKKQKVKSKITNQKSKPGELPGYKVEIKNINSFRFLKAAVEYEIERQRELLKKGERVVQETRGFDEEKGVTFPQRGKEGEADYRYFPEPDIPPMNFSDDEIEGLRQELPELPEEVRRRFLSDYGLRGDYVEFLVHSRQMAGYFEEAVKVGKKHGMGAEKIAGTLVNKKPDINKVLPAKLVEILRKEEEVVVLPIKELDRFVVLAIKENLQAVTDYKKGKEGALQFLVGQVMGKAKGKADARKIAELLKKQLK